MGLKGLFIHKFAFCYYQMTEGYCSVVFVMSIVAFHSIVWISAQRALKEFHPKNHYLNFMYGIISPFLFDGPSRSQIIHFIFNVLSDHYPADSALRQTTKRDEKEMILGEQGVSNG